MIDFATLGENPYPNGRELRPYQVEAVEAVQYAHRSHTAQRAAVVLPTGAGKSSVIGRLALDNVRRTGTRTLMLAHRGELLDQMADSVRVVAGDRRDEFAVGIVQAGRNEVDRPIVAGTVQTVFRDHRLSQLENVGLVLIDECHRSSADSYQAVLAGLGCFVPGGTPAAGFTATLSRGDDRRLGDTWDEVVYRKTIRWAIDAGYLVEPHGKTVVVPGLDLDSIKRQGGDIAEGELGEVIGAHAADIAKVWALHAAERRTMVFVPTVESAYQVAFELFEAGAVPEVVVGATPRIERDSIYERFRGGEVNVLVSVAVLTEGFDMPSVDCVLMARPTTMHHVYVQAVGRGLRPSPGKTDCLVLDVTGVSRRFALTTLVDLGLDSAVEHVNVEGETIEDEELAEDEGGELPPAPLREVEDLVDVDLFGASPLRWRRTSAGTLFVRVDNDRAAFLWHVGAELYRPGVIRTRRPYTVAEPLGGIVEAVEVDVAKAAVESFIRREGDPVVSEANRGWLRKTHGPTENQIRLARNAGIANPEVFTRGALADAIDVAVVSHLIDPK